MVNSIQVKLLIKEKKIQNYFEDLSQNLSHISIEEADCMIETIEKFYQVMCERRKG